MREEDKDDEVDGRFIGAVCEYASTCDGPCAELTSHTELSMDPVTQLGYCDECIPLLDADVRERLDRRDSSIQVQTLTHPGLCWKEKTMKEDYGTATHKEIIAGMKVATKIAVMIQAQPNPAVRHMIKQMIALITVRRNSA